MYFSAQHLNIKLNQDFADFICEDNNKSLILCDGIGEFNQSQIIAEKVVEVMFEKSYTDINQLVADPDIITSKDKIENGGTTIIFAHLVKNNELKIQYLGNGGCVHLHGNFNQSEQNLLPYRYNHLINPHVSDTNALLRHLSKKSGEQELIRSEISISCNSPIGDILLFFTDGINSLEESVIIKDNEGRFWRHESSSIQLILEKLHVFLEANSGESDFQDRLIDFNVGVLQELKNLDLLEDDASLGIIITEDVLKFYTK